MLRSFALVSLLLASLVLIPVPATAQNQPAFVVVRPGVWNDGDQRLMPEVEVAEVPITVEVHWPPVPTVCMGSYTVYLSVIEKPSFASVVVSPATISGNFGATDLALRIPYTQPSKFGFQAFVSVARDAPAFMDSEYRVKARLEMPSLSQGCMISGSSADGTFIIKNDYLPGFTAAAEETSSSAPTGTFVIHVQNIANGPTRILVRVSESRDGAFESLVPPPELRLESRASKGSAAIWERDVRIQYQLAMPGTHSFTAILLGQYDGAGEGLLVDEQQIVFSVSSDEIVPRETSDELAELPGFAHLAALGAMLGVAVLRRRRG